MNCSVVSICRGCACEVDGDPVSLLDPDVKDLYQKCTYQSLPDPVDTAGPQQICQECHMKCQKWFLFKMVCKKNEKLFLSKETAKSSDPLEPTEYTEYTDGSMEDMVLLVEEDEEELLAMRNCDQLNDKRSEDDNNNSFVVPDSTSLPEDHSQEVEKMAITVSQQSQDDVEWWVCHLCDANLIGSETYQNHLQQHIRLLDEADSKARILKRKAKKENLPKQTKMPKKTPKNIGKDKWKCSLCAVTMFTKGKLEHHVERDHIPRPGVLEKCPICPSAHKIGNQKLSRHVLRCHMGSFKCFLCFESFRQEAHLKTHKLKCHSLDLANKFDGCPLCNESFQRGGLEDHLVKKHLVSGLTLDCPACSETYRTTQEVFDHIASYHAAKWKCRICWQQCFSAVEFLVHKKMHLQLKQKLNMLPRNSRKVNSYGHLL